MAAAFTADYMEAVNLLSVAGRSAKTKPIKPPELESWRIAATQGGDCNFKQTEVTRTGRLFIQ